MFSSDSSASRPLQIAASIEAQVYLLFALAMGLTGLGVLAGMQMASVLLSTGMHIVFLMMELGIIFTSRLWMRLTPLNYLLFGLFPLFSGITVTPYLMYVLAGYANGGVILSNALASTLFMGLAAAVFARTTTWNLSVMGRALFFALLGLVFLGVLQIFIPAMRSTQMELILSGVGVVVFALFTAHDLQRIQAMGRMGASPFLLALSLYLDIFNLFLSIVRFMLAMSGNRR